MYTVGNKNVPLYFGTYLPRFLTNTGINISYTNENRNEYSTMFLLNVLKSVSDVISASHRKSRKFPLVSMKYCEF